MRSLRHRWRTEQPGVSPAVTAGLEWVALAALAAWLVIRTVSFLSAAWPFDTDDAFITLRYARHLAEGHGIVWNIDETPAVEGYSNFSFVVLGALAIRLNLDPLLVFKAVSVVALAVTCVALWVVARRWVGPLAAMAPAFVLASYEGTIHWTVSGLETAVYQCVVVIAVACFVIALDEPARPSPRWLTASGVSAFLAGLTRPEGAVIGVILALALLVHLSRTRVVSRPLAAWLLAFGIPYAIYFAWRLLHFGQFLPNSVACKWMHQDEALTLLHEDGGLALAYVPFAFVPPRRFGDIRLVVLLAIPAAYACMLYGVDPIIGHFNRHALTPWALLLVPATTGLTHLLSRVPPVGPHAGWLATWVLVMWAVWHVSPTRMEVVSHAEHYAGRMEARRAVGEWLRDRLGPGDAYLVGDCGLIPYASRGTVIDAFCLNNAEMTSAPLRGDLARVVSRVFERQPRFLVVHSEDPEVLAPRPEYGFYPALVGDPAFAQYRLVTRFGTAGDVFHYWIYERE